MRFRVGDADGAGSSNLDRIVVAERLDVVLAAGSVPSDHGASAALTLRNTGNGREDFLLAGQGSGGDRAAFAVDLDGDGRFDPGRDLMLTDRTPVLGPGESVALLVMMPGAGAGSSVAVQVRAATGSGAPGTTLAGQGDGGGDAVVGPTGAAARLVLPLVAGEATPTLAKSQVVRAPDGSERPVRGAIVTYTLDARFPDATRGARIEDDVPAGTRFVPNSLLLDGAALSDAADDDPGTADGARVAVSLGDLPGPATRRVQFSVQIQ